MIYDEKRCPSGKSKARRYRREKNHIKLLEIPPVYVSTPLNPTMGGRRENEKTNNPPCWEHQAWCCVNHAMVSLLLLSKGVAPSRSVCSRQECELENVVSKSIIHGLYSRSSPQQGGPGGQSRLKCIGRKLRPCPRWAPWANVSSRLRSRRRLGYASRVICSTAHVVKM